MPPRPATTVKLSPGDVIVTTAGTVRLVQQAEELPVVQVGAVVSEAVMRSFMDAFRRLVTIDTLEGILEIGLNPVAQEYEALGRMVSFLARPINDEHRATPTRRMVQEFERALEQARLTDYRAELFFVVFRLPFRPARYAAWL